MSREHNTFTWRGFQVNQDTIHMDELAHVTNSIDLYNLWYLSFSLEPDPARKQDHGSS